MTVRFELLHFVTVTLLMDRRSMNTPLFETNSLICDKLQWIQIQIDFELPAPLFLRKLRGSMHWIAFCMHWIVSLFNTSTQCCCEWQCVSCVVCAMFLCVFVMRL